MPFQREHTHIISKITTIQRLQLVIRIVTHTVRIQAIRFTARNTAIDKAVTGRACHYVNEDDRQS